MRPPPKIILLASWVLVTITTPVSIAAEPETEFPTPHLADFQPVAVDTGWLLLDQRLYWTATDGQSWQEITPPRPAQAAIVAVDFLDDTAGWLVLAAADEAGWPAYSLAQTGDGGLTWQVTPLSLFQPGEPAAVASEVYLGRLDHRVGWLVFRQAGSSNFNRGTLFKTSDGGQTWRRLPLPLGEPVTFVTPDLGWQVGGLAGNDLYRTTDGGQSWQAQADPPWPTATPLTTGRSPGELLVFEPGDTQFWRIDGEPQVAASNLSPPPGMAVDKLKFASPTVGWASFASGDCAPAPAGQRCVSVREVRQTVDGGQSWAPLRLPGQTDSVLRTELVVELAPGDNLSTQAVGSGTTAITGQGFDKCEIPSLSQLLNWITNSPYRTVNLYIGGSARACANSALTASFIDQARQQGWSFIPTWVGPQASCSGFSSRMSSDPTTAYNQGVSEANAALAVAANLGLTLPDQSGTIIYYDLENYDTGNSGCRAAAKSFISGWTSQLRARGNQAGVYGSACASAISDFATIATIPDAIWPAHWLLPAQYRSNASVWGVACLSDGYWSNHQRIRQYAGGHSESWGALSLTIDSNVIDGIVAKIPSCDTLFCDVPQSNWAYTDINLLYNKLTRGCNSSGTPYVDLNYCPDEPLDRAALAVFLLRRWHGNDINYQPPGPYRGYFSDVPSSHQQALWIEELYERGITAGSTNCAGTGLRYCPDATVTRGEFATFLLRIEGYDFTSIPYSGVFDDVPSTNPHAQAIEVLWWEGWTNGGSCVGDGFTFCPDDPVNRDAAAVFMARVFGLVSTTMRCSRLTALYASPSSAGTVSRSPAPDCPADSTRYRDDTAITLTANPSAGYRFKQWSTNVANYAVNPSTLQLGGADQAVVAFFEAASEPTPTATPTATRTATPTPTATPTQTAAATPTPVSGADPYEPDSAADSARWLAAGQSQSRSIAPATDVDWVKFTLPTLSAVTLQTASAGGDTRLWLYSSRDLTQPLDFNDDVSFPEKLFSRIGRQCGVDALPAGTYYVKVDEYGNNDEITYALSLSVDQTCSPAVYLPVILR